NNLQNPPLALLLRSSPKTTFHRRTTPQQSAQMSSSQADWEYPEHKVYERVPGYDEIDLTDRKALLAAREQKLRDDWVRAMEVRVIREQLSKCYKTEGVNHYQNCRHLADLYLQAIRQNNVVGYRGREWAARNSRDARDARDA
ncbi:hypothetical protein BC937DRAFT_90161, partial [Endogone sp. FLAS-F59071]